MTESFRRSHDINVFGMVVFLRHIDGRNKIRIGTDYNCSIKLIRKYVFD